MKKIVLTLAVFLFLVGLVACAKTPGTELVGKELPLVFIGGLEKTNLYHVKIIYGEVISIFVYAENIEVRLRDDAKDYTTFVPWLLTENKILSERIYKGGTILVPIKEDIIIWEKWLKRRDGLLYPKRLLP